MKKIFLTFFVATSFANAIFAQTPFWTYNSDGTTLNPASANVGIGTNAVSYAKLRIMQNFEQIASSVYGFHSITQANNAYFSGTLYGANLITSKNNSSSGNVYGLFMANTNQGTGIMYGTYSNNINYNTSAGDVWGHYVVSSNSNQNGSVYGLYSEVSGGNAANRYAGYFTGGKFSVINGDVTIGTTDASNAKLRLVQDGGTNTGTLYGLYSTANVNNASSTGALYGAYLNTSKQNSNSSGIVYGLYNTANSYGKSGNVYGSYSTTTNYNSNNANIVYGNYVSVNNYNTNNGTVYGLYATVNGGKPDNRYSGYFTSGKFVIMDGNVGIGTDNPGVKLDVVGHIRAQEVRVCLNQGCDFVFEKDYNLMPLSELSEFITENKHLPEVAPAAVMESEGINLSEMNAKLLQKVEELTLYVIDLQKQIDELKK